jgi:hypothetical protein
MSNQYVKGWLFCSSGSVESFDHKIEICKNKHPNDYQIAKEWIDQIK